ncbi:MAG: glutamate--tRNA ligase [Clostridiales bacterium GWE2_32_10]|nr:MAG: glutamate--tRNA ligase [Clostridiales bacterium GWE2_32_10]HBY21018.1 glutamate--tRNA ligase [Clostridiales bacterium]
MEIRTRFAPSPTGFMHVGGVRTALFNYLIAKKNKGTFILRIEDTDQKRYTEGALEVIYKTLKDLGLFWDEGPDIGGEYGPYVQSERKSNYLEYAKKLVNEGKAYYCFCSNERLEDLREKYEKNNMTFVYDGICRGIEKEELEKRIENGEPYVIRFKTPKLGTTVYEDEVYGKIIVKNSELEDLILVKSDGMPTYNFANVIDDHEMGITHIARGNEYISSTPKYKLIYEALGWETPKFIHLPIIKKNQFTNKKLSKRDSDATVEDLNNSGYLNEAILNMLALTGWSPGGEKEIFSLQEMVEAFSIEGISSGNAIFDTTKLNWMNGIYIRKEDIEYITDLSIPFIINAGFITEVDATERREWLKRVINAVRGNLEYLAQITGHINIFFGDTVEPEDDESKEILAGEQVPEVLKAFKTKLEQIEEINEDFVKGVFKEIQKETGIKGKNLYMPIRVAITGQAHGPEMNEILYILGRDLMLTRLGKMGR